MRLFFALAGLLLLTGCSTTAGRRRFDPLPPYEQSAFQQGVAAQRAPLPSSPWS